MTEAGHSIAIASRRVVEADDIFNTTDDILHNLPAGTGIHTRSRCPLVGWRSFVPVMNGSMQV